MTSLEPVNFDLNFFKKQMSQLIKPFRLMEEKLDQILKTSTEKWLIAQVQRKEPEAPLSAGRKRK